jgi:hypothetical protein
MNEANGRTGEAGDVPHFGSGAVPRGRISLTPKRKSEIAKNAAKKRWAGKRKSKSAALPATKKFTPSG